MTEPQNQQWLFKKFWQWKDLNKQPEIHEYAVASEWYIWKILIYDEMKSLIEWWQLIRPVFADWKIDYFELVPQEAKTRFWSYEEHWIQRCSNCTQKVAKKTTRFWKNMFTWWLKLREHAVKNNLQIVNMKNIDLNKYEYWRINHLVRFWLAYKNESMWRGEYGIPRKTRSKFLKWDRKVAEYFLTDPTIQEWQPWRRVMSENRITVYEVPSVRKLSEMTDWNFSDFERNEDLE